MSEQKQWYGVKAFVMTLIGGPIATTYMLGKNFMALGMPAYASLTYLIGGVSSFILFTLIAFIPKDFFIVPIYPVIFFLSMLGGLSLYRTFQLPLKAAFPPETFTEFDILNIIGVTVVGVLIDLLCIFWGIFLLWMSGMATQQDFKPPDAAKELSHCFTTFTSVKELNDQEHAINMRKLLACTLKIDSSEATAMQICTKKAVDSYIYSKADGTLVNRKEVDAEFIRCLSRISFK